MDTQIVAPASIGNAAKWVRICRTVSGWLEKLYSMMIFCVSVLICLFIKMVF